MSLGSGRRSRATTELALIERQGLVLGLRLTSLRAWAGICIWWCWSLWVQSCSPGGSSEPIGPLAGAVHPERTPVTA